MLLAPLCTLVSILAPNVDALNVVQVGIVETTELSPDTPITVSVPRLGSTIVDASLQESLLGADGDVVSQHFVPVVLSSVVTEASPSLTTEMQVRQPDGTAPLRFDGLYRLRLVINRKWLAFPFPRDTPVTQEYTFETMRTPHVRLPGSVVELRYGEPLLVHWSAPVEDFEVEVVPSVGASTRVDPEDRQTGYVELRDPDLGQQYTVHITGGRGANGTPVIAMASITVKTPAPPKPVVSRTTLSDGRRITLHWDRAVGSFDYRIVPEVASTAEVDPHDARVSYIMLDNPRQDQEYRVRITGAVGISGAPLRESYEVAVSTPPPLQVTQISPSAWSHNVDPDALISAAFSEPIQDRVAAQAAIVIDPPIPGRFTWPEPNRLEFVPQGPLPHGAEIVVSIQAGPRGVRGASSAYLEGMVEYAFLTQQDEPLQVVRLSPRGGAYGVGLDSPIGVTFGEPIRDRPTAEAAIVFTPPLAGHFEWPELNRVVFIPDGPLPALTDIQVRIQDGGSGARGISGAYFAEPYEYSFLTRPDKRIDVDLTGQRITLYEGDTPVFSALVSTGVWRAETPTGEFMVDYKLASTRMQGVNPSGSRYDIANVPWVMSFLGDYTIHGAPWRTTFGFPQSNGCVSLPTAAARFVYDWAPEGTLVRIHY